MPSKGLEIQGQFRVHICIYIYAYKLWDREIPRWRTWLKMKGSWVQDPVVLSVHCMNELLNKFLPTTVSTLRLWGLLNRMATYPSKIKEIMYFYYFCTRVVGHHIYQTFKTCYKRKWPS